MRFDILTLFPEMFPGYLSQSLLNLAIENGLVDIQLHNIRDWSSDTKHHKVDDRPFGGGAGMVLQVGPVVEAVEAICANFDKHCAAEEVTKNQRTRDAATRVIMLTPGGQPLNQRVVERLATHERLILLCGRYEGFDQRICDILEPEEISLGDFIVNGGEVAAMVLVDAVVRLVPGVLGDEDSSRYDSFSTGNRLLEYAQYTRPREYRGHEVPEVLLSGDHERIAKWRDENSFERTKERRPDLLED